VLAPAVGVHDKSRSAPEERHQQCIDCEAAASCAAEVPSLQYGELTIRRAYNYDRENRSITTARDTTSLHQSQCR
jgi:hypothetical protein